VQFIEGHCFVEVVMVLGIELTTMGYSTPGARVPSPFAFNLIFRELEILLRPALNPDPPNFTCQVAEITGMSHLGASKTGWIPSIWVRKMGYLWETAKVTSS
jgi:hypothetical protein